MRKYRKWLTAALACGVMTVSSVPVPALARVIDVYPDMSDEEITVIEQTNETSGQDEGTENPEPGDEGVEDTRAAPESESGNEAGASSEQETKDPANETQNTQNTQTAVNDIESETEIVSEGEIETESSNEPDAGDEILNEPVTESQGVQGKQLVAVDAGNASMETMTGAMMADTGSQETKDTAPQETKPRITMVQVSEGPENAENEADSNKGSNKKDSEEDNINYLDANGNLSLKVEIAKSTTLPLIMTLENEDGEETKYAINSSGQSINIKPGNYVVTDARDGDNRELSGGARLTITEDSRGIYLDFSKKPKNALKDFIIEVVRTNIWMIIVVAVLGTCFVSYKKLFGVKSKYDYDDDDYDDDDE